MVVARHRKPSAIRRLWTVLITAVVTTTTGKAE